MTERASPTEPMHRGGFERRAYRADQVRPRRASFSFPRDIPKLWVGNSVGRTHFMNGMNLFLPPFERMMVRVLRNRIIPRLTDPRLIEQARGFMQQEGVHGQSHALFLETLKAQGYDIDGFVRFASWFFDRRFEETLGTKLCLSLLAGFEHYTDILVLLILQGDFLEGCDPRMRELFAWHAAEEVEHNAVAYELLRELDDGYALRMAGNVLGLAVLLGFILSGAALLMYQDKRLFSRESAREMIEIFFTKHHVAPDIVELFVHYARRDYHPTDADYSGLASGVLAV